MALGKQTASGRLRYDELVEDPLLGPLGSSRDRVARVKWQLPGLLYLLKLLRSVTSALNVR